jgi:hypothetical protein
MMPVVMHFSTFLKLLTLNTGDKIRHLEGYASPGGFDFYRPSREGAFAYCAHGRSRTRVAEDIKKNAASNALERNLDIFEDVANWLDKQKGERNSTSRGVWRSPKKTFSIHIEPELGLIQAGRQKVVAVYPRKEPRINRDQAGAAILLLSEGYKTTEQIEFGILDCKGGKAFWSPTNVSQALLTSEVAMIEAELNRIMG